MRPHSIIRIPTLTPDLFIWGRIIIMDDSVLHFISILYDIAHKLLGLQVLVPLRLGLKGHLMLSRVASILGV